VSDNLVCGSSLSNATVFGGSGDILAVAGSTAFYASGTPVGTQQVTVSTREGAVRIGITWVGT